MSARKSDRFYVMPLFGLPVSPAKGKYSLAANQVKICKNGLEFYSDIQIELWTELKIDLQSSRDDRQIRCTGVVVSCTGNNSSGYSISLLFTNLTSRSREILDSLKLSF